MEKRNRKIIYLFLRNFELHFSWYLTSQDKKEIYVESNSWFLKIKSIIFDYIRRVFNYCWPWLRLDEFTWKSYALEQSGASLINLCHVAICIVQMDSIFGENVIKCVIYFFKISKTIYNSRLSFQEDRRNTCKDEFLWF